MKFRPARHELDDAMDECVEIPATPDALADVVNRMKLNPVALNPTQISVRMYLDEMDSRIGWKRTYIVKTGYPFENVLGFSDGPVMELLTTASHPKS